MHGNPLGPEEVAAVKTKFGFDPNQSFYVPPQVAEFYRSFREKGKAQEEKWNSMFAEYEKQYPELAAEFKRRISGQLPHDWKKVLPTYKPTDPEKATRQHSQAAINALAKVIPDLVGGSADLNPSTLSYLDCSKDFQKNSHDGRNIRFGVREHAMAAVCNGLAAYGGIIPYCATFLNFIG